jgi:predicted outer membrane protein
MKNRLTTLHILLIAGLLSVSSCSNATNDKARDMADSATVRIDTAVEALKDGANKLAVKVENALKGNPDSIFVVDATLDNNKEMRLLQAGINNGANKELKAHARMMLADHNKLGANVKAYSATKGYLLPDGDNGKADDELATLSKKTP